MTNTTPVNASAVEELRKEFKGHCSLYSSMVGRLSDYDLDKLFNWFLTHASTLSDSTLREVLGEVGEDDPFNLKDDDVISSARIHRNGERQRTRAIITKRLEK